MTARDELIEELSNLPQYREIDAQDIREAADAILARWRLVPVEEQDEPDYNSTQQVWIRGYNRGARDAEAIAEAQHRAASELTRHDTDAGHYGITPSTDQHGPHED